MRVFADFQRGRRPTGTHGDGYAGLRNPWGDQRQKTHGDRYAGQDPLKDPRGQVRRAGPTVPVPKGYFASRRTTPRPIPVTRAICLMDKPVSRSFSIAESRSSLEHSGKILW